MLPSRWQQMSPQELQEIYQTADKNDREQIEVHLLKVFKPLTNAWRRFLLGGSTGFDNQIVKPYLVTTLLSRIGYRAISSLEGNEGWHWTKSFLVDQCKRMEGGELDSILTTALCLVIAKFLSGKRLSIIETYPRVLREELLIMIREDFGKAFVVRKKFVTPYNIDTKYTHAYHEDENGEFSDGTIEEQLTNNVDTLDEIEGDMDYYIDNEIPIGLTYVEREVLRQVAKGKSYQEINSLFRIPRRDIVRVVNIFRLCYKLALERIS